MFQIFKLCHISEGYMTFFLVSITMARRVLGLRMEDVGKCKVVLVFNKVPRHEGVLGSGGMAPCILDLGTRK